MCVSRVSRKFPRKLPLPCYLARTPAWPPHSARAAQSRNPTAQSAASRQPHPSPHSHAPPCQPLPSPSFHIPARIPGCHRAPSAAAAPSPHTWPCGTAAAVTARSSPYCPLAPPGDLANDRNLSGAALCAAEMDDCYLPKKKQLPTTLPITQGCSQGFSLVTTLK